MQKVILSLVACLTVSGCAAQRLAEQKAAFDAAVSQCRSTIPRSAGNYVNRARCVNDASEQFSPPSDAAAPLIRATRLSLAAKIDRGEISPEDAQAELARVVFEARQEQQRTGAAMTQANAAMIRALFGP